MNGNLEVLYVEDDPQIRLMYRINLEADGFTVREAEDGEVALGMLAERLPDIILADIVMPRVDGVELARRVRETCGPACPPIVFLSANPMLIDEQMLSILGDEYLRKPFPPASLGPRLREVIRRRSAKDAANRRL